MRCSPLPSLPRFPAIALSIAASLSIGAGCSRPSEPAERRLRAPSDAEAGDVARRFFEAYVALDVEAALGLLCLEGDGEKRRTAHFIQRAQGEGSRHRVSSFEIVRVEPTWHGSEPCFEVDVRFRRSHAGAAESEGPSSPIADDGATVTHRYAVRAREGCLELFPRPQPPPSAEPMSPAPSAAAPSESPLDLPGVSANEPIDL